MKTKDRIKEEIGFDKLLMTITLAILSSLVGWLFGNRNHGLSLTIIFIFLTAVIFTLIVIFLFKNISTKIRELDYE